MPKCDFNKVAKILTDLVTSTNEILNGKLHFLCIVKNTFGNCKLTILLGKIASLE